MTATSDHKVDSFDLSSTTPDEVVKSLIKNGGCFIRNLVDGESISAMIEQVRPYLEADKPWEGDFFPKETRRRLALLEDPLKC